MALGCPIVTYDKIPLVALKTYSHLRVNIIMPLIMVLLADKFSKPLGLWVSECLPFLDSRSDKGRDFKICYFKPISHRNTCTQEPLPIHV